MTTLKDCPFCGGEAKLGNIGIRLYWVECSTCYAQGASLIDKEEAIAAWNARKEAP